MECNFHKANVAVKACNAFNGKKKKKQTHRVQGSGWRMQGSKQDPTNLLVKAISR